MPEDAYRRAGVDLDAGRRATDLMKQAVRSTYGPEVLSDMGSFGGLYAADSLKSMDSPVLVASTDGVGTKTMVAAAMNRWNTIGADLVNHCVNDILVGGAQPLFFLDYVASSHLDPEQIASVVHGCADACKSLGCALLGGETAEMPGVYQHGEIDLVGTVVGIVERNRIIDGRAITPGDLIMALPSTGLHTNGYSLARRTLDGLDWRESRTDLDGQSIGDALLEIHRCYLPEIRLMWDANIAIHGLAHITGGGVIDNLPRVLPSGCRALLRNGTWKIPPVFDLIQREGDISPVEMMRAFNMGLGMLVVLSPEEAGRAREVVDELCVVGEIVTGESAVEIVS